MTALSETVSIVNQRGLHARAAAKLVKCAGEFACQIDVTHNGTTVIATSIMGLMMLAAAKSAKLTISADGQDAEKALQAVVKLIADRFDEDE